MTKKYSKSLLDTKISICILSFNVNIDVQATASYQRQVSDGDYEQVVKKIAGFQKQINNKKNISVFAKYSSRAMGALGVISSKNLDQVYT